MKIYGTKTEHEYNSPVTLLCITKKYRLFPGYGYPEEFVTEAKADGIVGYYGGQAGNTYCFDTQESLTKFQMTYL